MKCQEGEWGEQTVHGRTTGGNLLKVFILLKDYIIQLELNHLSLPLLISSQLKVLASLQSNLGTELAVSAFQPQDNLLGSLSLETYKPHFNTPYVKE